MMSRHLLLLLPVVHLASEPGSLRLRLVKRAATRSSSSSSSRLASSLSSRSRRRPMSPTAAQLQLRKSLAPVGMFLESLSQTRLLLFLLAKLDDNANETALLQSTRQAGSMFLTTPTSRHVRIQSENKSFPTPSRIFQILSAGILETWTNHWSSLTSLPIQTPKVTLKGKGAQGGKESSHSQNPRRETFRSDVVVQTSMR